MQIRLLYREPMMIRALNVATAAAALVFLAGAAPAPDPMLGRIIAGARAVMPAAIAFERQSRTVSQESGGEGGTQLRVDRWDGRSFTLISVNGKPPATKDIEAFRKAVSARPVPGYHRIADLLPANAVRQADAQGRITYRVTGLPKGSVNVGKDVSANLNGEFTIGGFEFLRCRRRLAPGRKLAVHEIEQRQRALGEIGRFGEPVIHLDVDVRVVVGMPRWIVAVVPEALEIRRQAART